MALARYHGSIGVGCHGNRLLQMARIQTELAVAHDGARQIGHCPLAVHHHPANDIQLITDQTIKFIKAEGN